MIEYGQNKLPESSRNALLVFLGYMWNPLSWAMEAAAIIAIALLDYADFALIVGLLILNSVISFVEESSADKAIKVHAAVWGCCSQSVMLPGVQLHLLFALILCIAGFSRSACT